ncbi:F-box only protein 38-like isoform X2 [Ostrea edulis]|uniref:F-box only protein 38-like isoform X2 n=1 Tax=Ostrea edulis TaxID=37623 RepID=UPI0024AFA12C|nr:F-box only protein 38-like isoform X2 [Ostrea edulis]
MKGKRKTRCIPRGNSDGMETEIMRIEGDRDYFQSLSLEIICHILGYLPLRHVLRMDCMNHKLRDAVSMYLRIQKEIDMSERDIYGWMCDTLTDSTLTVFLKRCHDLESLYGFHPGFMTLRRQRGVDMLTLPGIIDALSECKNLKGIEISDVVLLHAMMDFFPQLEILGTFKNRNGTFPINCSSSLTLAENAKITSLHLNGIVIENLPKMYNLRHLQLRWVHFHESNPFNEFMAPKLQTFVMAHCSGPASAIKYVPLVASLASSRYLSRLELLRVPFLGGLIHHVVQDSWQMNAFRQLRCIRFGACRHALEMDLGFLIITAAQKVEEVSIQPSLTKDNLFVALVMADVTFPLFSTLHLGFVDSFPAPEKWDNEDLIVEGLANVSEAPAVITDIGMRAIGVCLPRIKHLDVYNCPHILRPTQWFTQGLACWEQLTDLTLRRCHALKLEDFCEFISTLSSLQTLHLEQMFKEPPKGCSRVGLSAGTGMGLSSAMLNQHYQNAPPANPVVNNNNVQNDGANQNEGEDAAPANQNNDVDDISDNQNIEKEVENADLDEELVKIDEANQGAVEQLDEASDEKLSQNKENDNFRQKGNNKDDTNMLDDGVNDINEKNKTDTVSTGMETVVLYPGKDHKEKECAYRGLIITESSNFDQDTKEYNQPCMQNISVPESDISDKNEEIMASPPPPPTLQMTENMESDCQENEKHPAVNESGEFSDVKSNHGIDDSTKIDIKMEDATSSPQMPEDTTTKQYENTGKALFSATSRMRPTRSCVKRHRHHVDKSDRPPDDQAPRNHNSSEMPSANRKRSATNQNLSERPVRGSCLNEDGTTKAKVLKTDNFQCSLCLCHQCKSEKQYSCRKRSKSRGSEGKRKSTCNCECHNDNKRNRLSNQGAEDEGSWKIEIENSGMNHAEDCEKQEYAETCHVKKEVHVEEEVEKVDKSCEAKPEEIRQTLSRTENSKTRKGKKGRRQLKQEPYEGPKSNMRDECTSTGDPVVEEDHIQILKIKSSSLISLSLNNVGITSLVLDECPQLSKLSEESLAYEVALQEETLEDGQVRRYNKALFLRPMHQIDKKNLEHLLFSSPDIHTDICIIYDYNDQACNSSYNHMRVFTWGEVLTPLASELIDVYSFPEWSRKDWKPQYPWGRDIFRMYERNGNLSRHEIVTDMTLMRILKEKPRLPENQIHRFDHARGIYCPNTKGHYSAYAALDSIMEEMADKWCTGMMVRRHSCVIYINLSDTNGSPTYDPDFS